MDGGDNNDDTVGGLLQMFPLEAVQEFNVATQRYSAEYGRSNGAVLNVVTKSGTNTPHGSWFTLARCFLGSEMSHSRLSIAGRSSCPSRITHGSCLYRHRTSPSSTAVNWRMQSSALNF